MAPLLECHEASKHHLLEFGFSYWTDKPWFLTEEKFAVVLIIPSSWGSQLDGDLHQHRAATSTHLRIDLALIPLKGFVA
jgi:hypothetical protein